MPNSPIAETLQQELQRQLNQELAAAHAYQAMAYWCAHQNLKGFAGFFRKQSDEEQDHAGRIAKHLIDRGVQPALAALPAPGQEFPTLLGLARHAREMEQNNTRGIHAVYEAALAARDYPAQILMHWFIKEQVEEEAWTTELVARVEAATCAGSLMDLDRHIHKLLGEDKKD